MKRAFFSLWLLTAIVSCGPSLRVFSDYDKDMNIASYKTYTWLDAKAIEGKGTNPLYYNELNDKRIKTAVDAEMAAKGYRWVENSGDLILHYHIVVEDKTAVSNEPWGYNYSPYWVNRRVNVYQYREGSLIIDLMDNKANTLVWRGWATDVITQSATKDPQTAITRAVQAIYKKYPFTGM
jgi:Domain of unknown function (DUF4136)